MSKERRYIDHEYLCEKEDLTDEIARLRAEVEQLTKERDQFQAELGCGLHEGYKLVWCGECIKTDRVKAKAVVRAAGAYKKAYDLIDTWDNNLLPWPRAVARLRLFKALSAYRERA